MIRSDSNCDADVVDRQARSDLQEALVRYMRGDIRTFAFDDRNSAYLWPSDTEDLSVREMSRVLYAIHDDFVDHPISATPTGWATLRRIIAFLSTDNSIDASAAEAPTWPFRDEAQWHAHQSALDQFDLPDYDPFVHGLPVNHWSRRIPTSIGIAVIIAGLIAVSVLVWMLTDSLQ